MADDNVLDVNTAGKKSKRQPIGRVWLAVQKENKGTVGTEPARGAHQDAA